MPNARIRLLSVIPGPTSLGPILRDFARRPDGIVTALSDAVLPLCQAYLGDDTLIEIKPFGEVVRLSLEMCGEEALPVAQGGHCIAATAQASQDLAEESPFWSCGRFAGFHEAAWKTIEELRQWGIDESEMIRLATICSPRLSAKMRSLAAMSAEAERILNALGRQTHSAQLSACLRGIPERDGSLRRLLVFAGSRFVPLQAQFLRWLAESGVRVTVVVVRHATEAGLFDGASRIAEELGVEPEVIGDGNRIARNLFAVAQEHGGAPVALAIASAADPLAEVEWALRGCLAENQPERTAIFVRDVEAYAPLIEAAARRFDVPIRMHRRAPLLTNAFARLTLTTLEFCDSDDVRLIAPIVRSSYLALGGEEQAALNSIVRLAHRSRANQWNVLTQWANENQEQFPWLKRVLDWRADALSAPASYDQWTDRFRHLMDVLPWHLEKEGRASYGSDRDRRAQTQLQRVLANFSSVERVTDAGVVSLNRFVQCCRALWQSADVSIPSGEHGVAVVSVPESIGEVDTLFVLGMLEGVFPRRRSEDPILTDQERIELSEARAPHPPLDRSADAARAERDAFYRVCVAPRDRLVLSYPVTDEDRDNVPAFYLDRIRSVGLTEPMQNYPRLALAPELAGCKATADRKLRDALDAEREAPALVEITTPEALRAVTPETDEGLHPRELRDALTCPFMYVGRHRLGLRPKQHGARWHSLYSLPVKSRLYAQPDPRQAVSALTTALESRLDELYSDTPDWEIQLLRAGGARLIHDWVEREFVAREIWPKDPHSMREAPSFGAPGIRAKMPGQVLLGGYLPAVSSIGDTTVVHLYSGAVRDPKQISDAQRLFLGLYLLALYTPGGKVALEVDGSGGGRFLYMLTRTSDRLVSSVNHEVVVKALTERDDAAQARKEFFEKVTDSLAVAARRISAGSIEAIPGEHCARCDFGELCRRSARFGEQDSPFGTDWTSISDGSMG